MPNPASFTRTTKADVARIAVERDRIVLACLPLKGSQTSRRMLALFY